MVTRIALILAGLVLPATPGEARRAPDDDLDAEDLASRRQYERDEKKMIRELIRGWTWAAMPPVGFEDDDEAMLCDLHFIANCQSCRNWAVHNGEGAKEEDGEGDDLAWMSHGISPVRNSTILVYCAGVGGRAGGGMLAA